MFLQSAVKGILVRKCLQPHIKTAILVKKCLQPHMKSGIFVNKCPLLYVEMGIFSVKFLLEIFVPRRNLGFYQC